MRRKISWWTAWVLGFVLPLGGLAQAQRALTSLSLRTPSGANVDVSSSFTVEGTAPKSVLVRAIGPTLGQFGVPGVLADPVLRLHDATGAIVATNSGWGGTTALRNAFAILGAFNLDSNSKDAALLLTLNPGTYTTSVVSASGARGSVLLEIYDMDTSSRLAYSAVRQQAGAGGDALNAGFFLTTPGTFLIRALGPALANAGVAGAVANPSLTVFSGATVIATNDNWGGAANLSEAAATAGLMPLEPASADAAVLLTLAAGAYSVQVSGAGGASGITLLEVAQIDANRRASFAPALLVPPRDVTANPGAMVTLAAPAVGRPAPTFQWRKNGVVIPGATRSGFTVGTAAANTIQPADLGSYTVALSNAAGTTVSAPFVVGVSGVTVVPPAIVMQPVSQTVAPGASVMLMVAATGAPLAFQWFHNGTTIAGATQETLTLPNVQANASGIYTVQASNAAGVATSSPATLVVAGNPGLAIVTPPASQTVNSGESVTFSVVATGDGPLQYQWLRDGALHGNPGISPTLTISPVLMSLAGSYSVVVNNASGRVTSAPAMLTVRPRPLAGVYFGSFFPSGTQDVGTFALNVRSDGAGEFLGFIQPLRQALLARELRVAADRSFRFTARALGGSGLTEYHLEGAITDDGRLTGIVSDISLSMNAPAPQAPDLNRVSAGFYRGGASGSSALAFMIASASGETFVVVANGAIADAGRGAIGDNRRFDFPTQLGRISGDAQLATVANFTWTPSGGTPLNFGVGNDPARTEIERLINVSTRSQTGSGPDALIAGFVVRGDEPKPVLIRGIGPTLANFGVATPLSSVRLEVFRGTTRVAQGDDWGASAGAADVANAAARVNAFALPPTSRDAALLLTLPPGAYTAVVSGRDGATGISLAEIYDASRVPTAPHERIVNVATRSVTGSGDRTLIAGFVVAGLVPKRVLVRGVGPSLATFGVEGALAHPQLALYAGSTVLARNSGWAQSGDATAIAAAGRQTGAFALDPAGGDAALVLNLAPGTYSAQVSGAGTETGAALIEVYELP